MKIWLVGLLLAFTGAAGAAPPALYVKSVDAAMEPTYRAVFTGLENNGYFVMFEPNLGKNLALFADRWGEDYNRSQLTAVRSLVFSNPWYINQIANADPQMLSLSPLHVTLIEKKGRTYILFLRPGRIAAGTAAAAVALELEQDVIRAIEGALAAGPGLASGR